MLKEHTHWAAPKCPAIIFNNSGSMLAEGRVEKSMEIIRDIVRTHDGADFYVNDGRRGIPDFITHLGGGKFGLYSAPLIPMITGDDYWNAFAIAAIIVEYPVGVHIIDDGDGSDWLEDALEMCERLTEDTYKHPITVYMLRSKAESSMVKRYYDRLKSLSPEDSNITVYHVIPKSNTGYSSISRLE